MRGAARRGLVACVLLLALAPRAAAGQARPPRPLPEWGLHATGTAVQGGAIGLVVGPRFAVRTPGNTRVAGSLGAGVRGGEGSVRGTAAVEYLFTPRATGRFGVYAGGGLAGVLGGGHGGHLLAYLGAERNPGGASGLALEAGLGGGFFVRVGWHWRRRPAGGR